MANRKPKVPLHNRRLQKFAREFFTLLGASMNEDSGEADRVLGEFVYNNSHLFIRMIEAQPMTVADGLYIDRLLKRCGLRKQD